MQNKQKLPPQAVYYCDYHLTPNCKGFSERYWWDIPMGVWTTRTIRQAIRPSHLRRNHPILWHFRFSRRRVWWLQSSGMLRCCLITLTMEAAGTSERPVNFYQTTRRNFSENSQPSFLVLHSKHAYMSGSNRFKFYVCLSIATLHSQMRV
jgi:hypothetical protein